MSNGLGYSSESEGEVRDQTCPCGLQSDRCDRVVEVGLPEHRVLNPLVLGLTSEVQEAFLVGDLEDDQVVRLVVPVACRDGVVHHEGDGSVDRLGCLGTGWEIGADDDVELEGGFERVLLTVNASLSLLMYLCVALGMRNCRKCKDPIPSRAVVGGEVKVLGTRKFCLKCSPFGRHNTSPSGPSGPKLGRFYGDSPVVSCVVCGSTKKKGRGRRCFSCLTLLRKYRAKARAVKLLGEVCAHCGWDKDIAAFHFHHRDPQEKDFNISRFLHKSWKFIEKELFKCILLCANCHIIEHTNRPPAFYEELARCEKRSATKGTRTPDHQVH